MGRAQPSFSVRGRYPPSRASEAAAKMKRCGNSEEIDSSQRALAAQAPEAREGRGCAQMCARASLPVLLWWLVKLRSILVCYEANNTQHRSELTENVVSMEGSSFMLRGAHIASS